MRGRRALLLLLLAAALIASEAVVNPPAPTDFSMLLQPAAVNHSTSAEMSAAMMQEEKKMESWLPSQPDLTQMQQQQQQQLQHSQPPAAMPYPSMPNTQPPFMPANYYLPGNHYAQPPATEFRSEHYAYPFEPNYAYPVSQPQMDSSLVPTAKHFVIVSFIGLLLLFAIIQNSIAAAKRKDALVEVLSNRRKRELLASQDFETIEPIMTPEVESALKEDARVRCIQRTLCYENRKLFEDLGIFGKVLAKYLTFLHEEAIFVLRRSVQSSLKELSPGWDRLVEDAANAGLRGQNCDVIYRDCNFETPEETATIDEEEE